MIDDSLERTAYHEAGHISMAILQKRHVVCSSIEKLITFYHPDFPVDRAQDKINLCTIAGGVAEVIVFEGYSIGPNRDFNDLTYELEKDFVDEDELNDRFDEIMEQAIKLLGCAENRPMLDAFAQELLTHKCLDECQIRKVASRFGYIA